MLPLDALINEESLAALARAALAEDVGAGGVTAEARAADGAQFSGAALGHRDGGGEVGRACITKPVWYILNA